MVGIPLNSFIFLSLALPFFVLAELLDIFILVIGLYAFSGVSLLLAIFFFVLGDESPFVHVFLLSVKENNNVTSETWTRQ